MRYLISFSYDGTNYNGYQKQNKLKTIQNEIENALMFINNNVQVKLVGASRTDKGVHALNQKAHFDLDANISLYKLKCAINSNIPDDIYVTDVMNVSDDFHARYMVKRKIYEYKVNTGIYNPINRNYVYELNKELDIVSMNESINKLVGMHDFSAFANKEDKKNSYVRTLFSANIRNEKDLLIFTFEGDGFLKYQIRNMIGLLIEIGLHKKNSDDVITIMKSKDRTTYGKIAPPNGLYLKDVIY